ncbi:hypothetical protein [Salinilacihabitans rarus]|uniref:hypothetical protein n=1 Tax=Salinilacihabitans rarus TaxID=2961596 RepID=UPI0020C86DAD|nr:hypothetical protein [Salinilacihabitans rarus]
MALLAELLARVVGGDESDPKRVHYECRRCGKTLSAQDGECPACESGEVVGIEL